MTTKPKGRKRGDYGRGMGERSSGQVRRCAVCDKPISAERQTCSPACAREKRKREVRA